MGFLQLVGKMKLDDSFIPLIVPSVAAPVTFFYMKQYMESSLPLSLIEAARIDGSGEFCTFNSIVLPLMKPAIAVQAIFTFVSSFYGQRAPAAVIMCIFLLHLYPHIQNDFHNISVSEYTLIGNGVAVIRKAPRPAFSQFGYPSHKGRPGTDLCLNGKHGIAGQQIRIWCIDLNAVRNSSEHGCFVVPKQRNAQKNPQIF